MFNKYFDQLVDSILKLVSIDSVQSEPSASSPFGEGVGKCLQFVDNLASSFGFITHNEEGYYLTATIGQGEEFGILGHVDTVPYNKKEWTANPLGQLKDNTLYGRGVLDDKGPMLCCLYAVKQLLDEGYTLNKKIKFIFGGNEESGWGCIERYNQKEIMPAIGISPDADFPVINCEKGIAEIKVYIKKPSSILKINGGSRSNVVMSQCECIVNSALSLSKDKNVVVDIKDGLSYIKTFGKPAHGSTPEKGDNAFFHLVNYLSQFSNEYKELFSCFCHTDGSGLDLNLSDEQSGHLTSNVGVIKDIGNLIEITLDIRFPISYNKQDILNIIKNKLHCDAKITHFHDPLFVDKDDELIKSLLSSYEHVTNIKAKPITIGGGTYARALKKGVAFGPIFPHQESTIHQADERVNLDDLKMAYLVYLEALKNICF